MKNVALLGPEKWAIASINFFLKKYLSSRYNVCIFHWENPDEVKIATEGFFDVVISTADVLMLSKIGYSIKDNVKFIPVFHHNCIDTKESIYDRDLSDVIHNHKVFGVSHDIVSSIKNRYSVDAGLLPIGIDDSFWEKKDIKEIKTVGMVYDPTVLNRDEYERVKNSRMFLDICNKADVESRFIYGKDFTAGSRIYDGCDMVVCTSAQEGNPMALLECAAAKIPFISTKVGISDQFSSLITFREIQEAVSIVNSFKRNKELIDIYTSKVHEDVVRSRSWEKIVDEYWIPEIENLLQ